MNITTLSMTKIKKILTPVSSNYSKNLSVVSQKQKESLSDYVKRIRREKGLTTTDVEKNSKKLISSSYVTRIENEPKKKVSPEKLSALAKGLGISEEEIFAIARGVEASDYSAS